MVVGVRAAIPDGVINQGHLVNISHPVLLFLIKMVLSSKFPAPF
jgi:hypothetical protein